MDAGPRDLVAAFDYKVSTVNAPGLNQSCVPPNNDRVALWLSWSGGVVISLSPFTGTLAGGGLILSQTSPNLQLLFRDFGILTTLEYFCRQAGAGVLTVVELLYFPRKLFADDTEG